MPNADDLFVFTNITDDDSDITEHPQDYAIHDAPVITTTPVAIDPTPDEILTDEIDDLLEEFFPPSHQARPVKIVEPSFAGTADALTFAHKAKSAPVTPMTDELEDEVALSTVTVTAPEELPTEEPVEDTVEEPVEDTVEEPVEEPIAVISEESAEDISEDAMEETLEEPIDESPEEIAEEPPHEESVEEEELPDEEVQDDETEADEVAPVSVEDSVEAEDEVGTAAEEETAQDPDKRHPLMRFFSAVVPHVGDSAFDVVRKCILLVGVLVFIGAATYLVDDLILVPIHNDVLVGSLQQMYTPDMEPELSDEELNYQYPEGIDPAFKKLYYQNNDTRGWLAYNTADQTTFQINYPIVQSTDNDFYLYHDFNRTYNKNGTLFFDYRNDLTTPKSTNRHTIIYGHNMASGQMLAGLNKLLWGVDFARVSATFSMNTIYNQADYKVFAVMLVNNNPIDGEPFGYLRTDFNDNVEFAGFLSEILARSLYVYGDVDIRPDDEIVTLSTCTDWDLAHFKDGRTVVVARKVRPGENPQTDVTKITVNEDVLMPYGWYVNQKLEPHPYYTNPAYIIQPLDTLMAYLATSTAAEGQTTTAFTLYQDENGTFGILQPTMTDANGNIITGAQNTKPYVLTFTVEATPAYYSRGSAFDYVNTKIVLQYSNGEKKPLDPKLCAVEGFDSSKVGTCDVTIRYGDLALTIQINIVEGAVPTISTAPTTVTVATTVTTVPPATTATTTTTTTTTAATTTTTAEETTTTEDTTTEDTTTVTSTAEETPVSEDIPS